MDRYPALMRLVPTRRLLTYVAGAALVLAVGTACLCCGHGRSVLSGEKVLIEPLPDTVPLEVPSVTDDSPATTSTTAGKIWVQVAGAVHRPGVYEVDAEARVFEAVLAAGGFLEDADQEAVALAARLIDGCRVYVPRRGETTSMSLQVPQQYAGGLAAVPVPEAGGGQEGADLVSLNRASAEELEALPGIGPALAQRIIAYREKNGPFVSVDQLADVPGIGPAKLEQLRPLVGP